MPDRDGVPAPAVVVVTHDTRDEVLGCLASLELGGPGAPADVVVVDSGSGDDTVAAVRARFPDVRVLTLANAGFGRSANAGVRATTSDVVVVCNADVRFSSGALGALAGALAADAGLAAVGPHVRYPDGTVQASARTVPDTRTAVVHALLGRIAPDNAATRRYHGSDRPPDAAREVDWLSGCAFALRRSAFEAVGGFDPGYFLYVEDVDLGERLRAAGWRMRYEPAAQVTHRVGASTRERRLRALMAHARSLERYQTARMPGPLGRLLRVPLRFALAGWVLVTWLAERWPGAARSVTGERLRVEPAAPSSAYGPRAADDAAVH